MSDRTADLPEWVVAHSAEWVTGVSPFPGEDIAPVQLSLISDVGDAVQRARESIPALLDLSYADRARIFKKFHKLLFTHQDALLDTLQRETGKSRSHAMEEFLHVTLNSSYLANNGERILRTRRRQGMVPVAIRTQVRNVPKGVVGVISPWNYPLTLSISDGLAALMAGNPVVIKPDLQTVWSAIDVVELLYQAGIPEGSVQLVLGDGPTIGGALIDAVDYICFTGSTATGRIVAQQAAARLIGFSLELGGKNAMIIRADADLNKAVDIAVHSCFTSAGQLCVSTERIYVHENIYATFVQDFVESVRAMNLGAHIGWDYSMGSLTSTAQLNRVTARVQQAIAEGAQVEIGGNPKPEIGPFVFEPTVLTQVSPDMTISQEEVFGPVVFVAPYHDDVQAIQLANAGSYGLSSSVISTDLSAARQLAEKIVAGSVNINDGFAASFGSVATPMGGVRNSGLGRRHGPEGLLRFTSPQTIAEQRLLGATPRFRRNAQQWSQLLSTSTRWLAKLRIR